MQSKCVFKIRQYKDKSSLPQLLLVLPSYVITYVRWGIYFDILAVPLDGDIVGL